MTHFRYNKAIHIWILSKILLVKRNIAIFLSTLLVLGTLATILPSVQAAPYFEDRYNSDYQSYENRAYKSKDNNVILNKIKCNNINSNNNGVEVGLGLPNSVNPIAETEAENAAATNDWENVERNNNNNDFRFVGNTPSSIRWLYLDCSANPKWVSEGGNNDGENFWSASKINVSNDNGNKGTGKGSGDT